MIQIWTNASYIPQFFQITWHIVSWDELIELKNIWSSSPYIFEVCTSSELEYEFLIQFFI